MSKSDNLETLDEVAKFCRDNVDDLREYVSADDEDSEYFSGVQSAYAQVYYAISGKWLELTEIV